MCNDWFWSVILILYGVVLGIIGTLVIQLLAQHLVWV
jgi:tetrahydromethanopterin S-methyltransferase subunit G